eukprot:2248845-Pleurochrysis_carterae.AAC.1
MPRHAAGGIVCIAAAASHHVAMADPAAAAAPAADPAPANPPNAEAAAAARIKHCCLLFQRKLTEMLQADSGMNTT